MKDTIVRSHGSNNLPPEASLPLDRVSRHSQFLDRIQPLVKEGRLLHLGAADDGALDIWREHLGVAVSVDVDDADPQTLRLPLASNAFSVVVAVNVLEHLSPQGLERALQELGRVAEQYVFVLVSTRDHDLQAPPGMERSRSWWENRFFDAGFGKHPLYQQLTSYTALENERHDLLMAFERLPSAGTTRFTRDVLRVERDLHMDMLRESGRRSDAHVVRYMLAAELVRQGDRVIDAACGLGYGSALVYDCRRAASVLGIDSSAFAIDYGNAIFGIRRPGLQFTQDDVHSIARLPQHSADVVISFETLEHIEDPRVFVAEAERALKPGGRLICSVPNRWVDESGRDPNPHHMHVFDLPMLLDLFSERFRIDRVIGQTAGGAMKHHDAPRALEEVDPACQSVDPEWWIVAASLGPARPRD
jgi:SAM-dependent methyltransferase